VIVAPIFEEWIFRGLLYRNLRTSWGKWASIAVTTLVFAVIHPPVSCVTVVSLSVVTCLLVEKTGRIWPGIVAHTTLNAVVVASWNLTAM
jgi:membrane protease YdiL (CAAX protease family)